MPKNVEVDHNPMDRDPKSEQSTSKKHTSAKEIGKMKTRMALLQKAQGAESTAEEREHKKARSEDGKIAHGTDSEMVPMEQS